MAQARRLQNGFVNMRVCDLLQQLAQICSENPNAINYTIYTPIWTERGGYDKEMSEVALCPDNECGVIIS